MNFAGSTFSGQNRMILAVFLDSEELLALRERLVQALYEDQWRYSMESMVLLQWGITARALVSHQAIFRHRQATVKPLWEHLQDPSSFGDQRVFVISRLVGEGNLLAFASKPSICWISIRQWPKTTERARNRFKMIQRAFNLICSFSLLIYWKLCKPLNAERPEQLIC